MTPSAEAVPALLDRHAVRRAGGVPTVSVLVGPVGAGGAAWRRWAGAAGHPTAPVHHPADAPAAWLGELARRSDLPAAAVAAVADASGRDRDEFRAAWRAKTPADTARFWDAVHLGPAAPAVRTLADFAASDTAPSPDRIVAALLAANDAVRDVAAPVPVASLPALLFAPPSGADVARWFADAAAGIAGWAARVPAVPVAVSVTGAAWAVFLAAPESRAGAILREGVVEIPVRDAAAVARTLEAAGLGAEVAGVASVLAATGATDDLIDSAAAAVRATAAPPATAAADDDARSAAERYLFNLLESIPETAGRFELNAALDFRFGPRPAEVDLLARADRLAVEIDGYFHFRDPAAYRRDRAKDYELQRRGFFVIRFLADDVVRRVEQVRDRILESLTRTPAGGPP